MTVKSTKARLDRLERLTPRRPRPLYITATWDEKDKLWTAKPQGHPALTAAKLKPLRRKIRRKHGKNTYLVIIDKPRPLPPMDGDGIPLEYQELKGKKEDKEQPTFNFITENQNGRK